MNDERADLAPVILKKLHNNNTLRRCEQSSLLLRMLALEDHMHGIIPTLQGMVPLIHEVKSRHCAPQGLHRDTGFHRPNTAR